MINYIKEYIQRRKSHSYNDLWRLVYGEEQYKGLLRELNFYAESARGWKTSYEVVKKDNDRLNEKIKKISGDKA